MTLQWAKERRWIGPTHSQVVPGQEEQMNDLRQKMKGWIMNRMLLFF